MMMAVQSISRCEKIRIDEVVQQVLKKRKRRRNVDVHEPLCAFQRYGHAKLIFKLAIREVFWPHREDCAMRPRN